MIEPSETDVGRKVVYRPRHAPRGAPEEGVVTSVTAAYVFVRYGSSATSQATFKEDLEWVSPLRREGAP